MLDLSLPLWFITTLVWFWFWVGLPGFATSTKVEHASLVVAIIAGSKERPGKEVAPRPTPNVADLSSCTVARLVAALDCTCRGGGGGAGGGGVVLLLLLPLSLGRDRQGSKQRVDSLDWGTGGRKGGGSEGVQ
ncbi:unnamed protein product [Calypogeia fissa]